MDYKVIYFTRSGNSKRIAEKIALDLGCNVYKITDNMNWRGLFGFIKAGFYSSQGRKLPYFTDGADEISDKTIVVAPLWAGGLPPCILTYLDKQDSKKLYLIISSDGSQLKNRPSAVFTGDIIKKFNNEQEVLNNLKKVLNEQV